MNFDPQQQHSGRRLAGMGGVVLLHVLLVYALITGLQRTSNPTSTRTVEVRLMDDEVRPKVAPPPPTPPAPTPPPATPRVAPPPRPLPLPTAAPVAPIAETPAPVAAPQDTAPLTPPAPATLPAPPAPAAAPAAPSAAVICPGYKGAIRSSAPPREVMLEGVGGEVVVEFTVLPNGSVRNPIPISSTNPALNRWALNTVQQKIRCQGQLQPVQLRVPISVRFE